MHKESNQQGVSDEVPRNTMNAYYQTPLLYRTNVDAHEKATIRPVNV
jgi:hypothetical protein